MFEFADTDSSNCRVLFYKKGPFETNCPATIRSASSQTIASPLGLLEELFSNDPWRLLLCTILLNRTQRKQGVDLILWEFLKSWPTPRSVLAGNVQEIAKRIARLGMHQKRSQGLQQFCRDYIELLENKETQEFDWSRVDITKLYHCGDYAADAYQIFIQKKWHTVNSKDYALRAYCEWKRTFQNI
jgi:endonuclease III